MKMRKVVLGVFAAMIVGSCMNVMAQDVTEQVEEKKESVVVMPQVREVRYSGNNYVLKVEEVKGSTGKVTYQYFRDEDCRKLTTVKGDGAKKEGGAPSKPGIYAVVATVAADENYKEAVSEPGYLIIYPKTVSKMEAKNLQSGIKLTWSKRSEADGYIIYRKSSLNGKYEPVGFIEGEGKVSFTDKNYKAGQKYYYNIEAYADIYGDDENVLVSNKMSKAVQVIHHDLTITNQNGSVKLKWQKCSDTAVKGYKIYRKRAGESKYTRAATISSRSTTTWTDNKSKTVVSGKKAQYYITPYYSTSKSVVAKSANYTNYYLSIPKA